MKIFKSKQKCNYNINKNNLQLNRIDYPEKEEALNNNIPRKENQAISRVNQEIWLGYRNNNNKNISINNQTIDSKDDNNIAFGSERLVLKKIVNYSLTMALIIVPEWKGGGGLPLLSYDNLLIYYNFIKIKKKYLINFIRIKN